MTSRGQITDKWTRVCIECGYSCHVNVVRQGDGCPDCGADRWTRDRTKVKA